MVLNAMRYVATPYEKKVIDDIADDLIELDAIKFLRENDQDPDVIVRFIESSNRRREIRHDN